MSNITDIGGATAARIAVGVVAGDLSAKAETQVVAHLRQGLPVFVDSGAFGAFRCGKGDPDWSKVLALGHRLAAVGAGQLLSLVAPDRVGSQEMTLELLERYLPDLIEWSRHGVRILVPHQQGSLGLAEFHSRVRDVLGQMPFVPALPCKAAAITPELAIQFVRAVRPGALHLLGAGRSPRWAQTRELIHLIDPRIALSHDANRLRSALGRGCTFTERVQEHSRRIRAALRTDSSAEQFCDSTDLCYELYNTRGALACYGREAASRLSKAVGVPPGELLRASNDEGTAYGSALGDLLDQVGASDAECMSAIAATARAIARCDAQRGARIHEICALADEDGVTGYRLEDPAQPELQLAS